MTKQVVSSQLGQSANYVGAHLWNLFQQHLHSSDIRKKLNPSALFHETSRTGVAGTSFTPRLQIVDASGAFGALSTDIAAICACPDADRAHHDVCTAWSGSAQVFFRETIVPHPLSLNTNAFQDSNYNARPNSNDCPTNIPTPLTSTKNSSITHNINYWSDFLAVPLHPRSCNPLQSVHHNVTAMSHFATGVEIATSSVLNDLCDNLRSFVEECDTFGGLLLLTDADNGFAGVTSSYLSGIMEELGSSTSVLLFSVHEHDRLCSLENASKWSLNFRPSIEAELARNEAHLVSACMDHNVQYIPLSPLIATQLSEGWHRQHTFKKVPFNQANAYEISALPALALHAALSPLFTPASLSGMVRTLRTANFATYSSLFGNIPPIPKNLDICSDFTVFRGTVNVSDVWASSGMHREFGRGIQCERQIDQLKRRDRIVTSFGIPGVSGVEINIDSRIELPKQFPNVLESSSLAEVTESERSTNLFKAPTADVAIAAGLVDDRAAAVKALYGLRASITQRGNITGGPHDDRTRFEDMREMLTSRADDLMD